MLSGDFTWVFGWSEGASTIIPASRGLGQPTALELGIPIAFPKWKIN